jgi:hypothetical protein
MQTILNIGRAIPSGILKRFYVFLSMGLFFPILAWSQTGEPAPFVLSQRVGTELDSVEVEYFNIFPDLDRVRSVVYRLDNLENLRMLVSLANGKDTTVTFSKLATVELAKMIDRFEHLADSADIVNWKLLPGYSHGKFNFHESTGRNVKVTTAEGTFSGRLLHLSDTSLFLWSKKGDFEPLNCQRFIKKIPARQIKTIEIKANLSSKLFGASLGAGIAIGVLQLGYNVTGASDYLLSSNSIFLLGVGALVGAVGGFFFDGISTIGRYKDVNQDLGTYRKIKEGIGSKAMFNLVYPPELENFR